MPQFSSRSLQRLEECDERLQEICHEVIKFFDFTVLEGHRNKETQDRMVIEGKSKLYWPKSKHNSLPSKAVDIAPYPIVWSDTGRFKLLAGMMFGVAEMKNIKLRWGGDWNGNWSFKDQTFHDLPHYEVIDHEISSSS